MFEEYLGINEYSLPKQQKEISLFKHLKRLDDHHTTNSEEYARIKTALFNKGINSISDLPFLPVSIFKQADISSVKKENIYKVLKSSGTTGNVPSKIYLDRNTAKNQSLALSHIMTHVLGQERLPMLIIDSLSVVKDRRSYSARGAGILGMSIYGKKHHYILDDKMDLDREALSSFISKYNGQKILLFGFTFMVWKYLMALEDNELDLSNAVLIHSGGWKKLLDQAVDNDTFKKRLKEKFGLNQLYNFYGMVEQVGSVYLENNLGFLHCPNFSDVIIRNPKDFSVCEHGEKGLIQVVSVLPESYPGHSLLTEDIGVIMGEDDLEWKGKYFKILGRASKAELRGCSDTFQKK